MKRVGITSCWKFLVPLLASSLGFAVQPDRITGPIDSSHIVTLPGHVHRNAKPLYDQGRVEASFQLSHVTLLTLPSPSQQKALSLLVAEQQDPSSANYHKWLTPEQYAARFGLSQNDVQRISAWLKSQGLSVVSVARGRSWIVFSGTAAQIESAFRTEIHYYNVNGEKHFANATPPSIPAALSGVVTGIRGLDDFHPKPRNVRKTAPLVQNARPDYYDSSFVPPDFVAPGDIATIYDLTPLYASGIDGAGQKLAVVGQTDIYLSDLNNFRTGFGLTPISGCTTNSNGVITACNTSNFQYVLVGPDPGVSTSGDLGESDLDLEWSAATARGAQIIFVNSTDVFTSLYDAVDNDLAPVISMSYNVCEFDEGSYFSADEAELIQANSFGITVVNSSGDTGAAGCDDPTNPATNNLAVYGLAVSYPASSPEVTGLGGTAIPYPGGFASTYWGTTNSTDGGTALSYNPEIAWNDDVEFVPFCAANPSLCTFTNAQAAQESTLGIASSGGGPSNCTTQNSNFTTCVSGFPQPSWQTVTIQGQAPVRFTPDVSLLASPNFPGYIFCTQLSELGDIGSGSSCGSGGAAGITGALALSSPSVIGGTSASAQVFAGIVTVLNQFVNGSSSKGLGNINPMLYKLAATPSNNAFHQVTTGTNVVYCEPGTPTDMPTSYQCPAAGYFGYSASNFDATTGYNLVTGLGSVNVNNLAVAWAASIPTPSFTVGGSAAVATAGGSGISTITLTPSGGFTGQVAMTCPAATLPPGVSCSPTPLDVNVTSSAAATGQLTLNVAAPSAPGTTVEIRPARGTEYASLQGPPAGKNGWKLSAGSGLAAIFLFFLPGRRRYRATLWLICLLSFAVGCGGGSSGSGTVPTSDATTTKITAPATKAPYPASLNFTVNVTLVSSGALAGNGMVQLLDGGNVVATVAAVNGVATFTGITSLKVGTHAISASYLGDASTGASQSGTVNVTVTGQTTVGISTNPASSNSNATINLTVN